MVTFRILRSLSELNQIDDLQREVFGVSDLDLLTGGAFMTVAETGGEVIGAAIKSSDGSEELVGFSVGWGGYHHGTPRVVSDYLAVRQNVRSLGIGADLKRLQAALALARGFVEIVWTVDPLRAGNARLNFEKLGAYSDRYEINRYGETFGDGLYGGLPSDRLHVTWPITGTSVHDRLLGRYTPLTVEDIRDVPLFSPSEDQATARIHLPSNIDQLLADSPETALKWRLSLRESIQSAFAAGMSIRGFVPNVDPEREVSAYVLHHSKKTEERRESVDSQLAQC
jgi:predicted GNAT superfamily acetyltransferase